MQTKSSVRELNIPDSAEINADGMNASSVPLPKRLYQQGYAEAIFSVLDGVNVFNSTFKHPFDFFSFLTDDTDYSPELALRDWEMTPEGAIAVAVGTSVFVAASLNANNFVDDGSEDTINKLKRFFAWFWPYFRDVVKGLKNTFKGVRALLFTLGSLIGKNLHALVVPLSLLLGLFLSYFRIQLRAIKEQRKKMVQHNEQLLESILASDDLDEIRTLSTTRQNQGELSGWSRILELLYCAYNGSVDSFYLYVGPFGLYVGPLGLSTLPPFALLITAILSGVYILASMVSRIYEAYTFQIDLDIQSAQIDLLVCAKEIKFRCLVGDYDGTLNDLILDFVAKREALQSELTFSYTSAFLAGMRIGLAAYGAMGALLFTVAMILSFTPFACPPALLVAVVCSGIACLVGFSIHSLLAAKEHLDQQNAETAFFNQVWANFKERQQAADQLTEKCINYALDLGLSAVTPITQKPFMDYFEAIRSFSSGSVKGPRVFDLFMPWMEHTRDEELFHVHPIMSFILPVWSLFNGSVYACRALARGQMGRGSLRTFQFSKPTDERSTECTLNSDRSFSHEIVEERDEEMEFFPDSTGRHATATRPKRTPLTHYSIFPPNDLSKLTASIPTGYPSLA